MSDSISKFEEAREEYFKPRKEMTLEESQRIGFEQLYKDLNTPLHYDNTKGSIYLFCENQKLNSWEFDIVKRVARCRKKGQFKEDLEKTIEVIKLYLKEYE